MNSTEKITLKAFLIALAQQESPLPEDLQIQLKEISKNIPDNLGKLNVLGHKYLKDAYQETRRLLYCPTAERNKGPVDDIDERAERRKSEPRNILDIVDSWDDETLTENAKEALSADNPIEDISRTIELFVYPLF